MPDYLVGHCNQTPRWVNVRFGSKVDIILFHLCRCFLEDEQVYLS